MSVRGMIGESELASIEFSTKLMKRLRLSRSCGSAIAERHIGRKIEVPFWNIKMGWYAKAAEGVYRTGRGDAVRRSTR